MKHKPELLAPVGHVESFFAALENGADAVYLGLKQLSARASATNFSLEELASLVPFAHRRKISVHVALNSILTASEFPGILDLLQALTDLQVDALIVQDPGVFFLAQRHFPQLNLHASTLMTIHNHAGVNQLHRMGARRVVLARELTLQELQGIASATRVDLEIFVHGALCYSYSGLCMASSFRGGHAGLQGRCTQPCRLRFQQGRKQGYFLSCNDLCALPMLPQLKKLRLAAFKIEGRMKPADYIARVVKAYRLVLDAAAADEPKAVAQAQEWLAQSPARRLTAGFLSDGFNEEILTPHRSGSSGLWVGTVKAVRGDKVSVTLRHDLQPGDRVRVESSEGKEMSAFTVTEMFAADGKSLDVAHSGNLVLLSRRGKLQPGERLFRVGSRTGTPVNRWQIIRREIKGGLRFRKTYKRKASIGEDWPEASINPHRIQETLILKVGLAQDLAKAFQSPADWVILTASRPNLERVARMRLIPAQKKRFGWSLPPLVLEKEIDYYRSAVAWYQDKGFITWEVNNWGHLDLLSREKRLQLIAGYRFNVRNHAALAAMAAAGCRWSALSLEITAEELQTLCRPPFTALPMVCIYAWPPLFSSRLLPGLQEDRPFTTPRKDGYLFRKQAGNAFIFADHPVNWIEKVPLLRSLGFRCFLLDLSDGPRDHGKDFERVLSGFKRLRTDKPYSLFNFDRRAIPGGN